MAAAMRVSESGNTFVSASTMSTISYWSAVTPETRQIELKNSYSNCVMRSSKRTFCMNAMSITCESRLPRLPGFALSISKIVPHLATRIMGTRCCFERSTVWSS